METKTSWKTLKNVTNPNYVGEADFEPGEEKVVTIKSIKKDEKIVGNDGSSSSKTVIYFEEPVKPMILNVAKAKSISLATGSKFVEDWIGKRITLYIDDHVRAFGEILSAVRVRNKAPVIREEKIQCEMCGEMIKSAFNMNASALSKYTKTKYGKTICADCAKKIAAEQAKEMVNTSAPTAEGKE